VRIRHFQRRASLAMPLANYVSIHFTRATLVPIILSLNFPSSAEMARSLSIIRRRSIVAASAFATSCTSSQAARRLAVLLTIVTSNKVDLGTGNFLWLSAPRPIASPGTSFPAGVTDLQSWTRDQFLDPDWLRVCTDIIDGTAAPTFNATFSLTGTTVPEPGTLLLFCTALAGLGLLRRRIA